MLAIVRFFYFLIWIAAQFALRPLSLVKEAVRGGGDQPDQPYPLSFRALVWIAMFLSGAVFWLLVVQVLSG